MTSPSPIAVPKGVAALGIPGAADAVGVRSVPGWALRLALGGAAVAAALVVMLFGTGSGAPGLMQVLLVFFALGAALAPGSVAPLAVIIGIVLFRLAARGPVLDGGLLALIALLPLIHQLAGVCAAIPARSKCRWTALRPATIRYAIAVAPIEVIVAAVLAFG